MKGVLGSWARAASSCPSHESRFEPQPQTLRFRQFTAAGTLYIYLNPKNWAMKPMQLPDTTVTNATA